MNEKTTTYVSHTANVLRWLRRARLATIDRPTNGTVSDAASTGRWYFTLLVAVGVVHRGPFMTWRFEDLRSLVSSNYGWLTWQYLTIPGLTNHLARSILYLQQTPPFPNLILRILAKCFGWPYGTTYALVSVQAIVSIVSACVLLYLLWELTSTWLPSAF
jgi:hypothetical protein